MNTSTITTHTIDATGKHLGRVASEVAYLLLGKDRTDAVRNVAAPVRVEVQNVSKLAITEKKRAQKEYDRYTGYPGGRRVLNMEKLIEKKGYTEVFRKAVYGMLPNNKLRAVRMKKLIISE
jgi:large subunit ribosomal protein L13